MTTPTTRSDASPPISLAPGDRVCVIAGGGELPVEVAQGLARLGHQPFVILVEGERWSPELQAYANTSLSVGAFARLPTLLKRERITHVVMAGSVTRRPRLTEFAITPQLLWLVPLALAGLARGDNGLLTVFIGIVEEHGVKVVGPHQVVPDLLARPGAMTRLAPRKSDQRDLDAALVAARAIGALDIGQGAVAIGGRVVALEGVEGTDGLLERTVQLRGHGRLAGKSRGVLVKCSKPGQEMRADLPAIGPATVEGAHAAGLAGIGVEAGRSLVLDFDRMVSRADALGLFVVGLPAERAP